MVAVMTPATATTIVLRNPMTSAWPKVESEEYGSSETAMSKPARLSRNPKPDEMFERRRFSMVLSTIHATKATSARKTTT